MQIKKITVKNFLRYPNIEQSLDISKPGLTCVSGDNGVGKSTLLVDAPLFAFYGKYRTPKVDDIVNRLFDKDCKVGVEFVQDGETYTVYRYRKHSVKGNNVYLFKGDKDISENTATATNAKIQDLIKIPHIGFVNSAVFSTELYSGFLSKDISDRLIVFENILSLKEITLFYDKCKDIVKELTKNIKETNIALNYKDNEKKLLEDNLNTYNNNAKSQLLSMKKEKEELAKQIEDLNNNLDRYSSIDINNEKIKLNNKILIDQITDQILTKEEAIKKLDIPAPSEEMFVFSKYKDIDFESNKMKELKFNEDMENLKLRKSGYELSMQKISSYSERISNAKNLIKINEDKISKLSSQIEKLSENKCPFCGQILNKDKALEDKNNLTKEIEKLREEIKDIDTKELEANLAEERETYKYLLSDYNLINSKLDKDFIPNSDLVEEQFKNAVKVIEEYNKKKAENIDLEDKLNKEIEELKIKSSKIETTSYTSEELDNIESIINSIKTKIEECNSNINAIDKSVVNVYDKKYANKLKQDIETKSKEYSEIEKDIKSKKYDLAHYQYLQECFSNKSGGFKKFFIGQMLGLFNEKINQYLPFFFDDVKIKFDKNLVETLEMDGKPVSYDSFSQGQRQKAELSISFALLEVARTYFDNDSNLLVFDEVDKGLDIMGIRSMISILKGFDKQLSIFVVSHNPLTSGEIDNKITIKKDENDCSKIVI